MKKFPQLVTVLLALCQAAPAIAGGQGWSTDFAAAQKEAAESKKDLLMDFTGSDWCAYCKKLNAEVFAKEAFQTGVKDKFVLVEIDLPNDKSKLSAATLKQNDELVNQYGIRSFPTILLCDAAGKPFGRIGYRSGGAEAYVESLDGLRAKKTARDEAFAAAANASGVDRSKVLISALKALDLTDTVVARFYGDVLDQIRTGDPEDVTGFRRELAARTRFSGLRAKVSELVRKKEGDYEPALRFLAESIKDATYSQDDIQEMMLYRAQMYQLTTRYDDALNEVAAAIALAPQGRAAQSLEKIKLSIEKDKEEAKKPAESSGK